jgi:hypothetical protein
MLEIKTKNTLKVSIDGTVYEIRKPSIKEVQELTEALKKAGETGTVDVVLDHYESLGLPKNISVEMTLETLTLLGEHLNGAKKN